MGHAKEAIVGYPRDTMNVYQWKEVRLNLPNSEEYYPTLSCVAKMWEDGRVDAYLFSYMDDLRPMGPDAEASRGGAQENPPAFATIWEYKMLLKRGEKFTGLQVLGQGLWCTQSKSWCLGRSGGRSSGC
jgi:hypothetical protein